MIRKGICNTAILSYRPLLEAVAWPLIAIVAGFQGYLEDFVNECSHIQPQTGVSVAQPIVFQSTQRSIHQDHLGGCVIATCYRRVGCGKSGSERRMSEAFTHIWLVNFIPCSESLELSQLPKDNSRWRL